jgi:hypothetical protein
MAKLPFQLTQALNQEMDRKHFLQFSMAIFLASFGVSGFISAVIASSNKTQPAAPKLSRGYGSSKFGKS